MLSCSRCGAGKAAPPDRGKGESVAAQAAGGGGGEESEVHMTVKHMQPAMSRDAIVALADALEPLHSKLGKPKPGDWLSVHGEEGQSFEAYVESDPPAADKKHTTIYILPLGEFTEGQERLVSLTAEFMEIWFAVPVKVKDRVPLSDLPDSAQRVHPSWGDKQVHSGYVLDEILLPTIPKDAVGYLALTATDLWPGEGWNFVFGQASLSERVGVWSLYRKGNADGSEAEFAEALRRTLQTAVHEMGHMMGMLHCIEWECAMNGSNSLEESDRRPMALCPECLKKLWWATSVHPADRFEKLIAFSEERGMPKEKAIFEKSLEIVRKSMEAGAHAGPATEQP